MEKLHQQWDTIMNMNFYNLQMVLESYSKILEDRKEEEAKQAKAQGYDEGNYSPEHMMNQVQKSIPKINIPKF